MHAKNTRNGILLQKLLWEKNCSRDWQKLLEEEGQEFAIFWDH